MLESNQIAESYDHARLDKRMKVVILAGGLGTRLAEETEVRPKPMIEIGNRPILWHIMQHYAWHGFKDFYIALGYKGEVIKRYFLDYHYMNGGAMTVELATGKIEVSESPVEDWQVHLVDTGEATMTGGRIKRLEAYLRDDTFLVTYGDGVCNLDLQKLLAFHRQQGKLATVTAVRPPARFGELIFDGDMVTRFSEKPQIGEGWINGGFMVLEPGIFDYLHGDTDSLEGDALTKVAADRQLTAYRHDDFWQCMDTLREKRYLESLWQNSNAPWKMW